MEVYILMAHKNIHTKALRVHSARNTQCICVGTQKLKVQKDIHTNKAQTAPTHPSPPESATIQTQN